MPRLDPDQLLARIQTLEARTKRGRLKIFFGANAGVGKTYAMLEAGRKKQREGLDIVVGYLEPHGREETERLALGLEQLPVRDIFYRDTVLKEFDLDAALTRKPKLIFIDELAHSNAQGSRHAKRWQDIEDLLDAGMDVYTTVNVQHLESLADVIEGITGIHVQETLPDRVFDHADEVELIDLPPDELLQRLHEGKVYLPERVHHATENFFRIGNLIALRELALRKTADRVEAAMLAYREDASIQNTWAASERLLVCVGPDDQAARLVRAGRRMASALHAGWIVVFVETPSLLRLSEEERNRRIQILQLAESLGAEAVTLGGHSAHQEILGYARTRNVTRILIGQPNRTGWRRRIKPSTVDGLVGKSGDIDIHVVGSDDNAFKRHPMLTRSSTLFGLGAARENPTKQAWQGYAYGLFATLLSTALCWFITPVFELANLVMIYLLGATLIALFCGRGPAILVSILNVAAFDFFFVPPKLTFAIADMQYAITFITMLVVAMIISNLTASVRLQARVAGHRERRTSLLYAMSRELTTARHIDSLAKTAVKHTSEVFDSQVVILLPEGMQDKEQGIMSYPHDKSMEGSFRGADLSVAQWVFDHLRPAGFGTDSLPGHDAIYLPLKGASETLGVLAVLPANPRRILLPEQHHLLETFTGQIALALERIELADKARRAEIQAKTEEQRNALLSSVSHDLRTPLAVIAGAASSLVESGEQFDPATRHALAQSIVQQTQDISKLIINILEMTRLEGGNFTPRKEWHSLEEIIGAVLNRMQARLAKHPVSVHLPEDMPLLFLDASLIEQVFANLIENVVKYTPAKTRTDISVRLDEAIITVSVSDRGHGVMVGQEEKIFEKFARGHSESNVSGVGLGLAICRAIVAVHNGRIWVEPRLGGGAKFCFTLPRFDQPSQPPTEAI